MAGMRCGRRGARPRPRAARLHDELQPLEGESRHDLGVGLTTPTRPVHSKVSSPGVVCRPSAIVRHGIEPLAGGSETTSSPPPAPPDHPDPGDALAPSRAGEQPRPTDEDVERVPNSSSAAVPWPAITSGWSYGGIRSGHARASAELAAARSGRRGRPRRRSPRWRPAWSAARPSASRSPPEPSSAASATAWAWLPEEYATTPRRRPGQRAIALRPRN